MAYFKINNVDYSKYVSELKIEENTNYNSQTNAAGDTVVEYINKKRTIEVGIIPIDADDLKALMTAIDSFSVNISFINPKTNQLVSNVNCIIPTTNIEYYTIRVNNTMTKAFNLSFIEL